MDDNEDESRMDLRRNTDNDAYTDDTQMNRGPPAHHKEEQKHDPRHHNDNNNNNNNNITAPSSKLPLMFPENLSSQKRHSVSTLAQITVHGHRAAVSRCGGPFSTSQGGKICQGDVRREYVSEILIWTELDYRRAVQP
ncbi:hypothetical protein E4U25_004671 [Claviceps purpurea]|nr:hypothetical protein E4U25_004671 [Claviceps purpurea]